MTAEDIAKFSSPESPRSLPSPARVEGAGPATLLGSSSGGCISTGLRRLDAALVPPAEIYPSPLGLGLGHNGLHSSANGDGPSAGVRRGEVTEIVGPRGSGKTVLGMSLAAAVLRAGQNVVWIDTSGPMCVSRLESLLRGQAAATPTEDEYSSLEKEDHLQRLWHFHPPSLAHLMALISYRPSGFPPQNTGLIVIDTISHPFTEFPPRPPKHTWNKLPNKQKDKLEEENRIYYKHISTLVSNLQKLAVHFNCAVVTINDMGTGFRKTGEPMLRELISGYTWNEGVSTSILLYWHWLPWELRKQTGMKSVRIAEVRKAGEKATQRLPKHIVPFVVEETGLQHFMDEESIAVTQPTPYTPPVKRKRDETTSSPEGHRIKLEPKIEVTGPNDDDDDDGDILDPLPAAEEEDLEIPDSESDFADEALSIDSKQSFDPLDPPEELLIDKHEYEYDGRY